MTLPKKTTHPGQEVEGEVELALTIRKVVQACPPEVPPSLVASAIGLPSLIAPAIGIPALILRVSLEAQVHILNVAIPVTSPKVIQVSSVSSLQSKVPKSIQVSSVSSLQL